MRPWERVLNGIAYAMVVVFIMFVAVQLWHNVTADPVEQVRQYDERMATNG